MSKALHYNQAKQLMAFAFCALGENRKGKRYTYLIRCNTCPCVSPVFYRVADAVRWWADHLGHRTKTFNHIDPDHGADELTTQQLVRQTQYDSIEAFLREGPQSTASVAEAIAVSDRVARSLLRTMEDDGFVQRRRVGRIGGGSLLEWVTKRKASYL
jgi:hypothetical protein